MPCHEGLPRCPVAFFSPPSSPSSSCCRRRFGTPAHADRIQSLQGKIADAQVQEQRLQSDIGSIESRIRTLESQVGGVSTQLDALEHDLVLQQERLNRIRRLYQFQTQQLDFFSHEYNVSVDRLNARLIEIYESDQPSTLDVLMSSSSLSDFLEQVDYVRDIGSQDAVISTQVHGAKDRWHAAREKTAVTKKKVETVTRTIAVRTSEVRAEKQRLLISEKGLAAVRGRQEGAARLGAGEQGRVPARGRRAAGGEQRR